MRLEVFLRHAKRKIKLYSDLGFSAFIDDLLNFQRLWKLKGINPDGALVEGSISGRDSGYLQIVKMASSNEKVFSKFKSNREYREILEHVNREQGRLYLSCVNQYGSRADSLHEFIRMDYCKPFRYTYPEIGRVSPSNLRYAKVALDIQVLFGDVSSFHIAEIGIGYGGQYHAISIVGHPESYRIYDLKDVNRLALKYSQKYVSAPSRLVEGNINDVSGDLDLVISNYAFSELNRDLQEIYFNNVILRSKRGYLIYNDVIEENIDTIKLNEFASRIPGAMIVNEYPLTKPRNKLIIWGFEDVKNLVLG